MRAALGVLVETPSAVSLLGFASGAATLLLQLEGERSPAHWIATAVLAATAIACAVRSLKRRPPPRHDDDTTITVRRDSFDRGSHTGSRSGQVCAGFVLGDKIGAGGVGEVYRAARQRDGQPAAVKIMSKQLDAAGNERFLREVQSLRELRSPHVVEVLDWGRTPDGHELIAMELLSGPSLATILHRHGPLSLADTVRLVDEVALGLEAAHARGIIHRDIKPSNLLLADKQSQASWKVLDFGLSKIYGVHNSITRGCAVGTPGFMSPEQAMGEPLDARSDVFAMAVVAYCALTARPAFIGKHPVDLLYQVLHRQPEAAGSIVPLPADVDLVLALGMAKHVAQRPPGAAAFAAAFRAAARGELDAERRRAAAALLEKQPWQDPEEGDTLIDWSKNRWPGSDETAVEWTAASSPRHDASSPRRSGDVTVTDASLTRRPAERR
jgi:serine/threonine protein kinase